MISHTHECNTVKKNHNERESVTDVCDLWSDMLGYFEQSLKRLNVRITELRSHVSFCGFSKCHFYVISAYL